MMGRGVVIEPNEGEAPAASTDCADTGMVDATDNARNNITGRTFQNFIF